MKHFDNKEHGSREIPGVCRKPCNITLIVGGSFLWSSNHSVLDLTPPPEGVSDPDMLTNVNEASHPVEQREQLNCRYVLMTAAYNEQANIERTIESVLSQSVLPDRWVIVSDGSSDGTDEIVQSYAKTHDFMRYLRISRSAGHSFRSKVLALRAGSKFLEDAMYEFIGNMDADVTVGPSYFEDLIARFVKRPRLGLAGGFVCEEKHGEFRSRRTNRVYSVAHAAQLVRRECYEEIGGYAVLKYGGEDWHAQVSAKMNGWEAEAFPELKVLHLRRTGEADNLLRHKFRQGRMDYSFGSDPLFEILKCVQRFPERPFILGSIAKLTGFVWSSVSRDPRSVSAEFISFLRAEQKEKLAKLRIV